MAAFKDVAAALGLESGATPDDALVAVAKLKGDLTAAQEQIAKLTPAPAADGRRYFALVRIIAGELGSFEPGAELPAEHALAIVAGMTAGEQYRTE